MKRWMGAFLALAVAAAVCPAGWAANEPYVFEEWDMEVTVPEGDYYVLLRDMDPESQVLTDVGLTVEQVNELLEAGNIYLDAIYYDASYELAVAVLTGEVYERTFDYAVLNSKLEKDATAAGMKRELERQGHTVEGDVSWYEGKEAIFFISELHQEPKGWSYQYQTVYNGISVLINASSLYLDAPTEEIKEQVRLLAEGIHFTKKLPVPQEVSNAYEEDGEEAPWSWSKLLRIVAGLLVVAVFSSVHAANVRKSTKKLQTSIEEESEKRSADDTVVESADLAGGKEE